MIRSIHILILCALCAYNLNANTSQTVQAVYGKRGASLGPKHLEHIESLFNELSKADTQTLLTVAQHAKHSLENEIEHINTKIESIKTENGKVSRSHFYLKFILQHQIKHLTNYIKSLTEDTSWLQKTETTLNNWYRETKNFFKRLVTPHYKDTTDDLIANTIHYIHLEQKKILTDYDAFIRFVVNKHKNPIPELLNFWKSRELQQKIKKRIKLLGSEVLVQMALIRMAADFFIQGAAMNATSVAWGWVDDDLEETYNALNDEIEQASDDYSTFQQEQVDAQQAAATEIIYAFTTQQTELQNQYEATNELLSQEIIYLNKSINITQPAQRYVINPTEFDTLFERSPMYTPDNGYQWYNMYQAGDWEFNSTTNSFWQYGLQTFGTPFWDDGTSDPSTNNIFCEYITNEDSYTIEVECTLITAEYPFFAGIIFNRSRWISGDPERLWGYRLLGLYGYESTPGDDTTRSIAVAFAEQSIQFPETADDTETITSPLELITTADQYPFELSSETVTGLETNPQIFTISITTSNQSVSYTISQNDSELYSGTASSLATYNFLYHGIGFMAPGCQAQFKLTQPERLVYTQSQLDAFETEISEVVS